MHLKPKSPAQKALLTATDGFCVRIAQAKAREKGAEFFIRLLTETLESDPRIRSARHVSESEEHAELFEQSIRTDVRDTLHQIGPLECHLMAKKPGAD